MNDMIDNAIAIIGMACKLPVGDTPQAFWQALAEGIEAVRFYGDDELRAKGVPAERLADPHFVKAAVELPGRQCFDAAFFGISPREASLTDPQQRLLLELAYHALEHGGYAPDQGAPETGVFVGADASSYFVNNILANPQATAGVDQVQLLYTNSSHATQIAYRLDLRGPCLDINTACSTSLVAVHQACRSLLLYECDMALAGGASVQAAEPTGYQYRPDSILSPDGHCRAFDESAAGTVPGQGAALVLLKRYEDALRDGDTVHALIRGSAINNDGANKVGYTAPSVDGQAAVLRRALAVADLRPDQIGYVECHGTGTSLGDPIELTALAEVYGGPASEGPCYLGSLKTNFGHLNSAAGVAGLMKAVLALQHAQLPPSLNYARLTAKAGIDLGRLAVNDRLRDWAPGAEPARAAVSSFGIGGTNAHVVLEAHVPAATMAEPVLPALLTLSAKTPAALAQKRRDLAAFLVAHPHADLGDVCHTANVGRSRYVHRHALVVTSRQQCIDTLLDLGAPATTPASPSGQDGIEARLAAAAQRWLQGAELDWATLYESPRRRIPIPTYPFEPVRHWIDPPTTTPAASPKQAAAATPGTQPRPALGVPYVAPRNEIESELALIWSQALGVDPVGVTDDFFDLGGHSLLATQVHARIHQVFGLQLTLEDLFDMPTVAGTAELLMRQMAALEPTSDLA